MKKILIAEDDKCLSEIFKEMFEEIGYDVNVALKGTDAVQILQIKKPDLIILDMVLPDMSGLEILELINKEYDNTQVIVYTAHEKYKGKILQLYKGKKFCSFFLKPVYTEIILSETEKLIGSPSALWNSSTLCVTTEIARPSQ